MTVGTRRAIIIEAFGACEVVTWLPWTAPDPTQDELDSLAATYVRGGGGPAPAGDRADEPGDGQGVATCRVIEVATYFPPARYTPEQLAAMAGLPDAV